MPPGAVKDDTSRWARATCSSPQTRGENFTDITGDLPDVPANWVIVRGGQLVVGTDIGVFASSDTNGSSWGVLGSGLPNVPITHLALKPGDPNTLVAATYGRGVYLYHFADPPPAATGGAAGPASSGVARTHVACRIAPGFARFTTNPSGHGLRLRAVGKKNGRAAVAVYRYTSGTKVIKPKRVVSFGDARRTHAIKGGKLADGWYAVQAKSSGTGVDPSVRSNTFHVVDGRFHRRADFYGRDGCGDVRSFRLSSPVFGGAGSAPLRIGYRTGRAGRVTVTLLRGRRTVKRLGAVDAAAARTYRLRLSSKGLKPGAYRVKLTLAGADGNTVRTLVSRRF